MKVYIAIFLFLLSFSVMAQDRGIPKDSLEAHTLDGQAWGIMYSFPDSAAGICAQALELIGSTSEGDGQLKYPSLTARIINTLAVIRWIQSDYPQALKFFQTSLAIRTEIGDSLGMAATLNNIGNIYYPKSQFPQAMEYFLRSLRLREELNLSSDSVVVNTNKKGLADSYLNIGNVYYAQFEYDNALKHYFIAVDIQEEIGNKQAMSLSLGNIGGVYMDQADYVNGLKYFLKALKLNEELNNKKGLATSYSNLGGLYVKMYEANNEATLLDTAMAYQEKALALSREIGDTYGICFRLSGIGKIYFLKGDIIIAITYLKDAVALADSIDVKNIGAAANSTLSKCYEKIGKHQLALQHYKVYTMLKDSMFNEQKSKDIGKLEAKHEFESAEAERVRALEVKSQKEKVEKSRSDNLQYSLILLGLLVLGALILGLGKLSLSTRMAEGLIFFSFLILFEFLLVLLDPYIEDYSSGAPAIKLAFNAGLAALIFPLHAFFETKLKGRLVRK